MKISTSLKLLFLALIFFKSKLVIAATVRVNNTLTTDKNNKIYATLQEAHDNSAAGDSLLVEGTVKTYADLNCTKRLVIIGTGYFLTKNPGQASSVSSTVQNINFRAGSEGSVIIGLLFSSDLTSYSPHVYVSGISIIRCYLTNGINIESSINSMIVLQNYIEKYGISVSLTSYSFSGAILKNNIFNSTLSINRYTNIPRIFAVVEHNIFLSNVMIDATSFRSNIIASASATVDVSSAAIQNNLTAGTQLSTSTGTQAYQGSVFVGLTGANNSPDGQYKLKSDSQYLTSGYNNEQPGVFGGTEPYVLSGIPPIPTIYELQADAVANKQDGLNVTIKARANP